VTSPNICLVTGAYGGIGKATAELLRQEGWLVIGVDVQPDPDKDVGRCDVTSLEDVQRTINEVEQRHGHIDALVNAAGVGRPARFAEAGDETWRATFDVNVMGTVRMCREALGLLAASGYEHRSIVNFTSQAAKTGGLIIGAPYSAAKAAVLCLTMTLAGELGPQGIRVNAVAPGIIETPFLDNIPGIRDRAAQIPLRRVGAASEVASVVNFLLSPAASYLTGETVDVNGGIYMD
jgi:3-oxoacyl-[acyl-carrier protein] reductase